MKFSYLQLTVRLAAVLVAMGLLAPANAADADKESKREIRRLQAQVSAVQKEKAEISAQLDEMKKKLKGLEEKSSVLEKKSGGQNKQVAELTEKYQESENNLQQITRQFTEATTMLQQLQKEKEQEHSKFSGDLRACESKNAQLYRISTDLMARYNSKGVWSALLQAEPFTRLEQVNMQNLMQEYRDKAEAARIDPVPGEGGKPSAPSVSMSSTDTGSTAPGSTAPGSATGSTN